MMIIYGKYGGVALRAIHLMVQNHYGHGAAWDMAIAEAFGEGGRVRYKNNPRVTFLTLCSLGVVGCILPCGYDAAPKTRAHVLRALELLARREPTTPINPDLLWQEVIAKDKGKAKHNNQMDVVLTLWSARIIELGGHEAALSLEGMI